MFSFFRPKDIGIDLGTANTLIYEKDSGIILNEPSVIAADADSPKILQLESKLKLCSEKLREISTL